MLLRTLGSALLVSVVPGLRRQPSALSIVFCILHSCADFFCCHLLLHLLPPVFMLPVLASPSTPSVSVLPSNCSRVAKFSVICFCADVRLLLRHQVLHHSPPATVPVCRLVQRLPLCHWVVLVGGAAAHRCSVLIFFYCCLITVDLGYPVLIWCHGFSISIQSLLIFPVAVLSALSVFFSIRCCFVL